MKKALLLDAYALIYRAYFSFIKNPRYNSTGLNTSAMLGMANTLEELINEYQPHFLIAAFDSGKTFRHDQYPDYKAQRQETPEALKASIPYIKQMCEAYGITVIEQTGYEADDIIGTVANLLVKKEEVEVYMVTPDKDYVQLIAPNIYMYKPRVGKTPPTILGMDNLEELYGITHPQQMIDILGLMGDASDNIPGCRGIGKKGAQDLISTYGSISQLYENIDQIKGKRKEKLLEDKEQVELSRELVTICTDIPVEEELLTPYTGEDKKKITALFTELEFATMLHKKQLKAIENAPTLFDNIPSQTNTFKTQNGIEKTAHQYHTVEDLQELLDKLSTAQKFAFHLTTTPQDIIQATITSISFSFKKSEAYHLTLGDEPTKRDTILNALQPFFADETKTKVGYDLKHQISILNNGGIAVQGKLFDTMIAHYLLHPDLKHTLEYLSDSLLNYQIIPSTKETTSTNEQLKDKGCESVDIAWQLFTILEKELQKSQLDDIAQRMEFPLIYVLAYMERIGVSIDWKFLHDYSQRLNKEMDQIQQRVFDMVGETFLLTSSQKLGKILFEKLKITDKPKLTKTKQYATDEETLLSLREKHPVIDMILEFRGLKKIISTYIDAFPKLKNPITKKIHTSYNQAVTTTGRLSSSSPNLQNIPIRTAKGREIRKAFTPAQEGNVLLAADFSQIELRLMAQFSQDEYLLEAFEKGADIHSSMASKIYKVPIEEVTEDMRRKAKTANFGIIYGISPFGLSKQLNISRQEAQKLVDDYFEEFPGIKNYMTHTIKEAEDKGYVSTLLGRKRYINDIHSKNKVVQNYAQRSAINAPIQGTAADIIKLLMIEIFAYLKEHPSIQMTLQVHDELVFDLPQKEVAGLINRLNSLAQPPFCTVPILLEIGQGSNWDEAH